MSLPRFDLIQPKSLEDACKLLRRNNGENLRILAGGTDLLVNIRRKIIPEHLPRCKGCEPGTGAAQIPLPPPKLIIALSRIPGLKDISEKDGEIRIGALTTIAELCESHLVKERLTALCEGAHSLGSPLVRNRGTFGGNICSARPAADTLIPATALKAQLKLVSADSDRIVNIEDFVTGPGETVIEPDEILTEIRFKTADENTISAFYKLANRKALEISIVNVAVSMTLDNAGKIADGRIVMGAVGPTPVIAVKAMMFLQGESPSEEKFAEAGKIAAAEARPINDHRGSLIYRREMVEALVRRTLKRAVGK